MARQERVDALAQEWARGQARLAMWLRFFFVGASLLLIQVDPAPDRLLARGVAQLLLLLSLAAATWLSVLLRSGGGAARRLGALLVAADLTSHLTVLSVLDPGAQRGFGVVVLVAVVEAATIGRLTWAVAAWGAGLVGLAMLDAAAGGLTSEILRSLGVRAFFTFGPAFVIGKQAERLALAVQRERDASAEHEQRAMTDELTGLRNRRWLFEALDDRVRRHEAYTRAWRAREADGAGEG